MNLRQKISGNLANILISLPLFVGFCGCLPVVRNGSQPATLNSQKTQIGDELARAISDSDNVLLECQEIERGGGIAAFKLEGKYLSNDDLIRVLDLKRSAEFLIQTFANSDTSCLKDADCILKGIGVNTCTSMPLSYVVTSKNDTLKLDDKIDSLAHCATVLDRIIFTVGGIYPWCIVELPPRTKCNEANFCEIDKSTD